MDDKDFNKIRTIVREEVATTVKQEISESETRLRITIKEDVASTVKKEVAESETRLRIMVNEEITASEGRIGQFLEERVIPLIDQKADKTDIDRLERKLDVQSVETMKHRHRLDTLEALPAIAHELKSKKRT